MLEGRCLTQMHAQIKALDLDWSYTKEQYFDIRWVCKLESAHLSNYVNVH